jgi:hypothetical protein
VTVASFELFPGVSGGAEENHGDGDSQGGQFPDQDSNTGPPEYETRAQLSSDVLNFQITSQ